MNAKQIEVQQVTIFHAQNLLISLKDEIMEIICDPVVMQHIQPDTTAIAEEFDALATALVAAGNFAEIIKNGLVQKYFSQFKVIDGLNQHPSGLSFDEWCKVDDLITNFGQPKNVQPHSDDIDEAEAMFNEHQRMKEAHWLVYGE